MSKAINVEYTLCLCFKLWMFALSAFMHIHIATLLYAPTVQGYYGHNGDHSNAHRHSSSGTNITLPHFQADFLGDTEPGSHLAGKQHAGEQPANAGDNSAAQKIKFGIIMFISLFLENKIVYIMYIGWLAWTCTLWQLFSKAIPTCKWPKIYHLVAKKPVLRNPIFLAIGADFQNSFYCFMFIRFKVQTAIN